VSNKATCLKRSARPLQIIAVAPTLYASYLRAEAEFHLHEAFEFNFPGESNDRNWLAATASFGHIEPDPAEVSNGVLSITSSVAGISTHRPSWVPLIKR
jgi:UDP-N-acetylmuramyl tripeptide synthase